jgi:hypothetical protein
MAKWAKEQTDVGARIELDELGLVLIVGRRAYDERDARRSKLIEGRRLFSWEHIVYRRLSFLTDAEGLVNEVLKTAAEIEDEPG